ncbi:MAG: hypothetical protein J1D87_07205 [Lachnospiraceae bacterium]|nr:hypothetical protein [Lachnospiraceae bacterium]
MKKNIIRGYIILAIIFVLFSVITIAIPFQKNNANFWLAYIFTIIAIAFQIYVFKLAFSNKELKSKFYGFPIARIGVIYLILQMILSILEMALSTVIPIWVSIILNMVVVSFAGIGCIATDAMKEEIEKQDEQLQKNVTNMRTLQSLTLSLVNQADNKTKRVIQDLADEFRYSDPVSCAQSISLENELSNMVNELQKALIDNDFESAGVICTKVSGVLSERNRVCKLNK